MNPCEMSRLDGMLGKMAKLYKEEWVDENIKNLYFRVLGDLSLSAVTKACDAWLMSDSPFFPKPGQLLALVAGVTHEESLRVRAERAWDALRTSAREAYNRWALADPITQEVFEHMGGGYRTPTGFGRWDVEWEEARRRQFIAKYCDYAARWVTLKQAALPALPRPQNDVLLLEAGPVTPPTLAECDPRIQQLVTGLADQLAETNAGEVRKILNTLWPENVTDSATAVLGPARQLHPAYIRPTPEDPEVVKQRLRDQAKELSTSQAPEEEEDWL